MIMMIIIIIILAREQYIKPEDRVGAQIHFKVGKEVKD
jgi:hypothetical protein